MILCSSTRFPRDIFSIRVRSSIYDFLLSFLCWCRVVALRQCPYDTTPSGGQVLLGFPPYPAAVVELEFPALRCLLHWALPDQIADLAGSPSFG